SKTLYRFTLRFCATIVSVALFERTQSLNRPVHLP
ncbi:MAG: hypothetical protein ACJAUM_002336, partial [Pseudomonadales bacterium]